MKCADANRRVTILSVKVLLEFVQGEHTTTATTAAALTAATTTKTADLHMQRNVELIFSCLKDETDDEKQSPQQPQSPQLQWQWWLGRLVFLKRLFEEHRCLLLHTSRENISRLSFPVSPRSEVDLSEFLNSLQDNAVVQMTFDEIASSRIRSLVKFSVDAISCSHKKVSVSNALKGN